MRWHWRCHLYVIEIAQGREVRVEGLHWDLRYARSWWLRLGARWGWGYTVLMIERCVSCFSLGGLLSSLVEVVCGP